MFREYLLLRELNFMVTKKKNKLKKSVNKLMKDLNNPLQSKSRINGKLLKKMKEEMWSS
jgi:hypothetical protein